MSKDLVCPITNEMFVDPVTTSDGMTYERTAIERWFDIGNTKSPLTNLPIDPSDISPNLDIKSRLPINTYPFKLRLDGEQSSTNFLDLLKEHVLHDLRCLCS